MKYIKILLYQNPQKFSGLNHMTKYYKLQYMTLGLCCVLLVTVCIVVSYCVSLCVFNHVFPHLIPAFYWQVSIFTCLISTGTCHQLLGYHKRRKFSCCLFYSVSDISIFSRRSEFVIIPKIP